MKKCDEDDVHNRAEQLRESARIECEESSELNAEMAVSEFESGETAQYFRENALYVTGLAVKRLEDARQGEISKPFPLFDSEMLAQLLAADATARYEELEYHKDLSDEETVESQKNGFLIFGEETYAETSASRIQDHLFAAMLEYATAAAIYAKHIGSASLIEWAEMIELLGSRLHPDPLSRENALRVIELERSAAARLRLDKIIAELPAFTSKKKARRRR